jgi:hypothetical protein
MYNAHVDKVLGYNDNYRSTPDSRGIYMLIYNQNWEPRKFLSMESTALVIESPRTQGIANACDEAYWAIEKAMHRSRKA